MSLVEPLWRQVQRGSFVLLVAALLLIECVFARSTPWADPGLAEVAILFDLCLFIPGLYLLLHRRKHPLRALLLRAAALFLLGLWIASLIVPPEGQRLLLHLSWLRPVGLAVLALIELKLMVVVARMIWQQSSADDVAARSGVPRWIARLMLIEARFWKALWRVIRRP